MSWQGNEGSGWEKERQRKIAAANEPWDALFASITSSTTAFRFYLLPAP